jgi:hypothetical protein
LGKKCNMCGEPYKLAERNIHHFEVNFEYGSPYDMETWNFNMCDECIACLVECFEIQHEVTERTELV